MNSTGDFTTQTAEIGNRSDNLNQAVCATKSRTKPLQKEPTTILEGPQTHLSSEEISDLSGITAYRKNLVALDVGQALFIGKTTTTFLLLLLFDLTLSAYGAIPAVIPGVQPTAFRVPDPEPRYTILMILGSIIFLLFDRIINTRLFRMASKRLLEYLESQSKETPIYKAYEQARSTLHEFKAQTSVPMNEIRIVQEPTDDHTATSIVPFQNTPHWKLLCLTFVLYFRNDLFQRFSGLWPALKFYVSTHGVVISVVYAFSLELRFTTISALTALLAVMQLAYRSVEKTVKRLADDDTASTCDATNSTMSSLYTRAENITRVDPDELAAQRGRDIAEMERCDLSVGSTDDSTISSGVSATSIGTAALDKPVGDPAFDAFLSRLKITTPLAVTNFIVTAFGVVPYKMAPLRCVSAHIMNFHALTQALVELHGDKIRRLWVFMKQELLTMGGLFGFENQADESPEAASWGKTLSDCVEGLKKFETSPVGVTASGFLALICTLPMLFQEFWEAETYVESWKVLVKSFKMSGASLSKIMSSFVGIYKGCVCAMVTGSPKLALKALLLEDDLNKEYMSAWELYNDYKNGRKRLSPGEFEQVRDKFLNLTVRYKKRVTNTSPPADIARAKECVTMYNDICKMGATLSDRMVPYTFALDGAAGCAKTSLLQAIIPLMHKWAGIHDIMHVVNRDITSEFDEATFNWTTCIVLDDQGNVRPEFRKVTLGGELLKLVQPRPAVVNKAAVEDKGEHHYLVYIIVLPDNVPERGIPAELYEPMAGLRRLGLNFEVKIRPEYDNGSGGLDKEKVAHIDNPYGAVQLFRPYRFAREGNSKVEKKYLFQEDDGWIDNIKFIEVLKEDFLRHRQLERSRLAKLENATSLPLCSLCNTLPNRFCTCGEKFLDPMETGSDSSVTSEVTLEMLTANPGAVFEASKVAISSFKQAAFSYVVTRARFYALANVPGMALIEKCVVGGALQAAFGAVFFFSLMVASQVHTPQSYFCALLALLGYIVSNRVTAHWKHLTQISDRHLVLHAVSLTSYLRPEVYLGVIGIAFMMKHRLIWNSLIRSLPIGYESGDKPAEPKLTAELLNLPADAPVKEDELVVDREPVKEVTPREVPPDKLVDDTPKIWSQTFRVPIESFHQARTISEEQLIRKVFANTFTINVHLQGNAGMVRTQKLTMLNECIGVTSAHVFLKEEDVCHGYLSFKEGEHHNSPPMVKVNRHQMYIPQNSDLAFLYLPRPLGHLPHLEAYLSHTVSVGKINLIKLVRDDNGEAHTPVEGQLRPASYEVDIADVTVYTGLPGDEPVTYKPKRMFSQFYQVHCPKIPSDYGHCGTVYITPEPRTIAGLHVAGDKHNKHIVQPLTYQMYAECLEFFVETQRFHPPLLRKTMECKAGKVTNECAENPTHPVFFQDTDEKRFLEIVGWREANHKPVSYLRPNPYLKEARKHLRLRLLKAPPPFKWRFGAHRVIGEATKIRPQGDLSYLKQAYEILLKARVLPAVREFKRDFYGQDWISRPLTLAEVASGIAGTPINCMDMSKSSGIGGKKRDYVIDKGVTTAPDGTPIVDRDFVPEVYEDHETLIEALRNWQDPGLAPTAFLKDELLKPGKTVRSVYNAPLQVYVASASYLRVCLEVINRCPDAFYTAIGMNPVGPEWFRFCKDFAQSRFIGNAFDLDQTNFDCSQSPFVRIFSSGFFTDMNRELGMSEEDLKILQALLAMMDDSSINVYGCVMYLANLLASGYLYTAHRNGLIGILLLVYDIVRFSRPRGLEINLDRDLCARTLGDDLVGAVSDTLIGHGWTLEHLVESGAHWGLKITTADKDSNFKFKKFEDTEFLKRYYNYHEDLQMNVHVNGPQCYFQSFQANVRDKGWEASAYYSELARSALLESFFGGRQSFEEIRSRLNNFYAEANLAVPIELCKEYEEYVEEYRPKEPQPQLFPVTERGIELIREYDALPPTELELTAESGEDESDIAVLQEIEAQVQDSPVDIHESSYARLPMSHKSTPDLVLDRRVVLSTIDVWPTEPQPYPIFDMMFKQDVFRDRFKNVAFVAATIEVTFEVIAPSTVAGLMMASVVQYPDTVRLFTNGPASLANLSQRDHTMIRIGDKETVHKITVPFFYQQTAVSPFDENLWLELGGLVLTPLSGLISSTDSAPGVQIRVYGQFKNLVAYGATATRNPGDFVAESSTKRLKTSSKADFVTMAKAYIYRRFRVPAHRVKFVDTRVSLGDGLGIGYHSSLRDPGTRILYHCCAPADVLGERGCLQAGVAYHETREGARQSAARMYITSVLPVLGYADPTNVTEASYWKARDLILDTFAESGEDDGYCYQVGFEQIDRRWALNAFGKWPYIENFAIDAMRELYEASRLRRVRIVGTGQCRHLVPDNEGLTLYEIACMYGLRKTSCVLGGEKISNTLRAAGSLASSAGAITGLGTLATAGEVISKAGDLAAHFGFSKPQARVSSGVPVTFLPNGMGHVNADTLTVNPYNEVACGIPGWDDDELTFDKFNSRSTIVKVVEIPPTMGYGDKVFSANVTPMIVLDDTVSSQPAACAAPALFMEYWRGSMIYEFKLVCPSLVSVKLAVYYDPLGIGHKDLTGDPKRSIEDYLDHVILDSSNVQSAEIVVGYQQPMPALFTSAKYAKKNDRPTDETVAGISSAWQTESEYRYGAHNGQIFVRVHDQVRGGAQTPPTLTLVITARAGPDMQYGGYRGCLPPGLRVAPPSVLPAVANPAPTLLECNIAGPTSGFVCESLVTLSPTLQTTVPPTMANTTAVPTTSAPTTGAPTSAVPTTGTPTTVPPAPTPTTPACTYSNAINAPLSFSSGIGPGVNWFTLSSNSTQKLDFVGNTGEVWDVYVATSCPYYEVTINLVSGTAEIYELSNPGAVLPLMSGSNTYFMSLDPGFLPTNSEPPFIGVLKVEATSSAVIQVTSAQGVHAADMGFLNYTPVTNPGTGMVYADTSDLAGALTTVESSTLVQTADTADGVTLQGYAAPAGKAFRMHNANYSVPAGHQQLANVLVYGTLKALRASGTIVKESSKNNWRWEMIRFPAGETIYFETPTSGPYPKALVRTISFLSLPVASPNRTPFSADPNYGVRRLRALFNYTRLTAETEVKEAAVLEGSSHYLGGPPDYSEYFPRTVAGETIVSFRPLLKIPHSVRTYSTPQGVTDSTVVAPIFTDVTNATLNTLYWFLNQSFYATRGSVVYHYNVIGDGVIEVSRRWFPDAVNLSSIESGFVTTDSRVNPFLSVRFQNQRPFTYTQAAGSTDDSEDQRFLRIYSWAEPVRVREARSTGEDFNFVYFRALPRLQNA